MGGRLLAGGVLTAGSRVRRVSCELAASQGCEAGGTRGQPELTSGHGFHSSTSRWRAPWKDSEASWGGWRAPECLGRSWSPAGEGASLTHPPPGATGLQDDQGQGTHLAESTWDQDRESGLSSPQTHFPDAGMPFLGISPGGIGASVPSRDSAVRVFCAPPGKPPNPPADSELRSAGGSRVPRCLPAGRPQHWSASFRRHAKPGKGTPPHSAPPRALSRTELALLASLSSVPPTAALLPAHGAPERPGPATPGCHAGSHCWGRAPAPGLGAAGTWRQACPPLHLRRERGWPERRAPCHRASGGLPCLETKKAAPKWPQIRRDCSSDLALGPGTWPNPSLVSKTG